MEDKIDGDNIQNGNDMDDTRDEEKLSPEDIDETKEENETSEFLRSEEREEIQTSTEEKQQSEKSLRIVEAIYFAIK